MKLDNRAVTLPRLLLELTEKRDYFTPAQRRLLQLVNRKVVDGDEPDDAELDILLDMADQL